MRKLIHVHVADRHANAATPGASLTATVQLTATATSTRSVSLTWAAAAFAAKYEVLRSFEGSAFIVIAAPTNPSYVETGVEPSTTYLYKVRRGDDDHVQQRPLSAGISAQPLHISELRTAVNAMRTAAGLGAATFTDPTISSGTPIKTRLEARSGSLRSATATRLHRASPSKPLTCRKSETA